MPRSADLEKDADFEATLWAFVKRQWTKPKPLPQGTRLTDQVAIITGSNVGLGLETSRQLLQLGLSHLVMGVRSQTKGDAAAAQLRTDFPSATISVWLIDMQSYDSIRAFATKCESLPEIDIAILNAGLVNQPYTVVPSTQHEVTLQVNYLSTALLALLLLPILKSKKLPGAHRPPVLSIVGSDVAYGTVVDANAPILPAFDNPEAFSAFLWYKQSKLLVTFLVIKLAELVDSNDVLINLVNPGMTKGTAFFGKTSKILMQLVSLVQAVMARSVELGAANYVNAVVAQGKESHGGFITEWQIKPYPKFCYGPQGKEVGDKVWDETIQELDFAGVSKIVESLKTATNGIK